MQINSFKMSNMYVCVLLLMVISLTTTRGQGPVAEVTPIAVAEIVAEKIYSEKDIFFKWDYEGAVIFDGLFLCDEVFHMNYTPIINDYLDRWINDKTSDAYKLIHNETIPYGNAVGDTISLFPINYLNRLIKEVSTPTDSFNKTLYEQLIKNDINKYILNWPYKLPGGTFSRHRGWEGQPDHNASFVWADDQYMGLTLLARAATVTYNMELARSVGEMALSFATLLKDPQDGLFYHGFNDATKMHSCCKWGRANGWGMMSHIEVLNAVANFPELVNTQMYDMLKMMFDEHVRAMLRHQSLDGRWHQVVDDQSTYLETSVTSMTLYTLTRAVLQHWLAPSHEVNGAIMKAWDGLVKTIDMKDGTVSGICMGTGIEPSAHEYEERPTQYELSGPGLGSVLYAASFMQLYEKHMGNDNQRGSPYIRL